MAGTRLWASSLRLSEELQEELWLADPLNPSRALNTGFLSNTHTQYRLQMKRLTLPIQSANLDMKMGSRSVRTQETHI